MQGIGSLLFEIIGTFQYGYNFGHGTKREKLLLILGVVVPADHMGMSVGGNVQQGVWAGQKWRINGMRTLS
jgi:hypothetical protein